MVLKSKIRNKFLKTRKNSNKKNIQIKFDKIYKLLKKTTNLRNKIVGGYYPVNYEIDDLNTVRTRAGLEPYTDSNNFFEKYINENMWEFFGEGKRLYTLTRIDKAGEVLGIEDFRRIYPIPAREFTIEGNQLVQNPGY